MTKDAAEKVVKALGEAGFPSKAVNWDKKNPGAWFVAYQNGCGLDFAICNYDPLEGSFAYADGLSHDD